ncbi:MAG: autotransporter domain-containing protein [Alphaproteobacteria bacterium]|nr:autotransporter domain-containing protein [Alphaproteobacteria bacterium]
MATINFAADGTLDLTNATGGSNCGNVIVSGNKGTLNISNTSGTNTFGSIGDSSDALKVLNITGSGGTTNVTGDIYATGTNIAYNATLTIDGNVHGAIAGYGGGNQGSLIVNGTSEVTGAIGSGGYTLNSLTVNTGQSLTADSTLAATTITLDGTGILSAAGNLTGAIVGDASNHGTLIINGTTVSLIGSIGGGGDNLNVLQINTGDSFTVSQAVNATTVNINGTGSMTAHSALTAATVNFAANGTLDLTSASGGSNITQVTTSTNNTGTLGLANNSGTNTLGTIGDSTHALNEIDIGGTGTTTATGAVYAALLNFTSDGTLNLTNATGGSYIAQVDPVMVAMGTLNISNTSGTNTLGAISHLSALNLIGSGGTTEVDGDMYVAATTIGSGATLDAVGASNAMAITGNIINNGKLALNHTTATLTGTYTQASAATLDIGVTDATHYGQILASGVATMTGAKVALSGNMASGESFTVVQAATGSDYSGVTATATGFKATVSSILTGGYNDLVIALSNLSTYGDLGQQAGGGAAPNTGAALDQIQTIVNNGGNASFNPILTTLNNIGAQSQASEQGAIKQLAPTQLTPQVMATNLTVGQTFNVIGQHQETLLVQNGGDIIGRSAGSEYRSGMFWGQISGGVADRASDAASDGYSQNYYGMTVGADVPVARDTVAGVSFGWMRSSATGLDSLSGDQVTVNDFQLTGYGKQRFGAAFVDGMLGVGYNSFDQSRDIAFLGETAKANYGGWQYVMKIDGGYDFAVGDDVTLTPLAGIQDVVTSNDSYTESGAAAADVSVGTQTFNTLASTFGGRVTSTLDTDWGKLSPEFKLGWVHDWTRGAISTDASLGGVGFTTATPRVAADGAQIGLAATLDQSDDFKLRVEYDGDLRSGYSSHTGMLKGSWSF